MSLNDQLLQAMAQRGYPVRVVTIGRMADLRADIEAGRRDGLYDEVLYRTYLGNFVYGPPPELSGARSLIIVAVRQPRYRFTFEHGGKSVGLLVPPTYLYNAETSRKVREALAAILGPEGYEVAPVRVPNKLLAARSGLAAYGRNNVTYVPGMGSFHRLVAFCSDLPCDSDEWHERRMMDRCEKCRLCHTLCPAGAIAQDRFLLHAERCIVFHNEKPSAEPFPAWMDPAWHNCLVGCLRCQDKCPENRAFSGQYEEGATFSAEETGLILAGTPIGQLPAALAQKLETHDLAGLLDVLPRNLKALLDRA